MNATATTECARIAAEMRALTQYLLGAVKDDLTPQQAVFQLTPSRTHILWLVGHITMSLDYMVSTVVDRVPALPQAHNMKFMFGAKPTGDPADYPPMAEMIANLLRVTEEVAAHLEQQDDAVLDREIPKDLPFHMLGPTVREFLGKAAFHTGYHAGQVTMLRAAQGLPAGFGM